MDHKQQTGRPSIDRPWLKYYSEEEINTPLPSGTMYSHIFRKNQDNLGRVALNYYGSNMSYGKFFESISQAASALEKLGVKAGDIVTVCMINSPEAICLLFALNKIGAVANMVHGGNRSAELRQYMMDARSSVVFTLDIFQEKILEAIHGTSVKTVVVCGMTRSMSIVNRVGAALRNGVKPIPLPKDSRFISWKQFLSKSDGRSSTFEDGEAPALITYTGGTTGGSKGVLLSNNAILAVAEQYIIGEKELRRESTWVQLLPLFIAYGVTCSLLIPLSVGMTLIVRIPMSDPIAALCKKFKPNHIMYGPAYWEKFADDNQELDLSYFIAPITGGDILRPSIETKVDDYLKKCGSPYLLMNGYGMTEVGAAVSCNYRHIYEFNSVGAPFVKTIISAFDVDTGRELTYGEEGEICIHTPSIMIGYLNAPEETANIIRVHEDGLKWVHSGDLGYVTEDGFVHISGRLKRYMLHIANGIQKKIFSLDIEKVLLACPEVENCAVVPAESKVFNQVPVAFLILKNGFAPETAKGEIEKFLAEKLEPSYRPVKYYFVEKFPLTKVGKVDYQALEQTARSEAAALS